MNTKKLLSPLSNYRKSNSNPSYRYVSLKRGATDQSDNVPVSPKLGRINDIDLEFTSPTASFRSSF